MDVGQVRRMVHDRSEWHWFVRKGLDEEIDEGVLWWFNHVVRMEWDRIVKSLCRRECW